MDFNKLNPEVLTPEAINPEALQVRLSVLQARIQFFEFTVLMLSSEDAKTKHDVPL